MWMFRCCLGMSVCFKLILSYVGVVVVFGVLLFVVVVFYFLRYVFDIVNVFFNWSDLMRVFVFVVMIVMIVLFVIGFGGGWIFVGWMLVFFECIGDVVWFVVQGLLFYWVVFFGLWDEFWDFVDVFDLMFEQFEVYVVEQQWFVVNVLYEFRILLVIIQVMFEVVWDDFDCEVDVFIV